MYQSVELPRGEGGFYSTGQVSSQFCGIAVIHNRTEDSQPDGTANRTEKRRGRSSGTQYFIGYGILHCNCIERHCNTKSKAGNNHVSDSYAGSGINTHA